MTINWTENLSVGDDDLDNDHKHLINIINKFDWSSEGEPDYDKLRRVLDELEAYVLGHFKREEAKLVSIGYPKTDAHKSAHRLLTKQFHEHREKFEAAAKTGDKEGEIAVKDIALFLKDWLINHVMSQDLLYKPYLDDGAAAATPAADAPKSNRHWLAGGAIVLAVVVFASTQGWFSGDKKAEPARTKAPAQIRQAMPAPKPAKPTVQPPPKEEAETWTPPVSKPAPAKPSTNKNWWLNSKCDKVPSVPWWKKIDHAFIVRTIKLKHDGNWKPYIDRWANEVAKLQDILNRGSSVTISDFTLKGQDIKEYIGRVEKRLAITRCLAREATVFKLQNK